MATKAKATTVLTLGPVNLPANGTRSITLPSSANGFELDVQENSWPYTGGPAVHYDLYLSYDGGVTWLFQTSDDISDDPQPATKGNLANTFKIITSADPEQGVARQARIDWQAFKSGLNITATLNYY